MAIWNTKAGLIAKVAAAAVIILTVIIFAMNGNEKKNDNTAVGYIGKPGFAVTDGKMTPEVLLSFGRLSDPQASPDGKKILYSVSYTSIEENRSCANLYICNIDGSGAEQVTFDGKSISNARWSTDGSKIIYIQGGQIWCGRLKHSGNEGYGLVKRVRISDIEAGISEFKLSPDQKKIMYVSTVQSALKKPSDLYADLDKSDAISADDLMYRHWDHWVKEIPHTFISDIDTRRPAEKSITALSSKDILDGEKELYELPTEPFGGISELDWSPDGNYIAYSCRKLTGKRYAFSTNTEIYLYNVKTGECTEIVTGGGYDTNPVWSQDGSRLCWVRMERDGYEADKQDLMVADVDLTGKKPVIKRIEKKTSSFKYNVSAPVWGGDDTGCIYFSALAEGIQGIFKISLSDGNIVRITGEDLWYDFNTPFHIYDNGGETVLLAEYCSMDFPSEIVNVTVGRAAGEDEVVHSMPLRSECRMAAGPVSVRRISDINGELLARLDMPETKAGYVRTVDGKDMLTWEVRPPHFDSTKVYPSILICLGGPQGTLSQGWSYRWNYSLMASQGYVVVLPNRRGTTAFGQEWTEQISGDYCGLNIQDYLSAAKALKSESYIGKMAACGASYGGYSVYYLCGVHGNTFDAFIAHAGIFNQEHMYMTTEEMWFPNWDNGGLHEFEADALVGTESCPSGPKGDGETFGGIRQGGSPWSKNPAAMRHYANSPHKLVTNWHTPLLVTHGEMDFRVPLDEGMAAYNTAQMMGVPSRLIVFPGENHWILKPQNALYWHREYFRWLDRWCR